MKFLPLLLASFAAVCAQSTCSPYRLVWVSCTGYGNGMDFVGRAVLSSLRAKRFDVDDSFVRYRAGVPRDASSREGATQLATDMNTYASRCPNQTFILGGYSQGGIVLHLTSLRQDVVERVAAVTVFGDPVPGNSYYPICEASRVVSTCADNDSWCKDRATGATRTKTGGVQNRPAQGNHQAYVSTADAAVNAVMESIKNPYSGSPCNLPTPSTIDFDRHLNYDP